MKAWIPILLTLIMVFGCTSSTQKGGNVKAKEDAKQINNPSLWPKPSNPVAPGSESNENLKVVKSFYAAYDKEDLEGIRQVMSEDVEWYIPG